MDQSRQKFVFSFASSFSKEKIIFNFFGHTGYVTLLQCHIYVNNDVD